MLAGDMMQPVPRIVQREPRIPEPVLPGPLIAVRPPEPAPMVSAPMPQIAAPSPVIAPQIVGTIEAMPPRELWLESFLESQRVAAQNRAQRRLTMPGEEYEIEDVLGPEPGFEKPLPPGYDQQPIEANEPILGTVRHPVPHPDSAFAEAERAKQEARRFVATAMPVSAERETAPSTWMKLLVPGLVIAAVLLLRSR